MKRIDGMRYFLLKGMEKVNGEIGLYYSATNIRRIINIKGVGEIKKYLENKLREKCKN